MTVAEWVRGRVDHWEASGDISARTAARYRELVENQIVPHLGAKLLQKLPQRSTSRNGTPRCATTAEPMARAALHRGRSAMLTGCLGRRCATPPRRSNPQERCRRGNGAEGSDEEMIIVKDVPAFIELMRGHRLFVPAMISLFTGMRTRRSACAALGPRRS